MIDDNSDLLTLDPGREREQVGGLLVFNMYETLLTVRRGNVATPVPLLAARWGVSDEGRTFTFTLRRDVRFSDGTPLTANDVVFSFNRLKNIKGNAAYLTDGLSIKVLGRYKIVIGSPTPRPDVPLLLTDPAFGVVNSRVVRANGGTAEVGADKTDQAESFLNRTSAGSGPYILKAFSRTGDSIIEVNPRYWGKKPVYTRVILRNVPPQAQLFDLQRGQAQIALSLTPADTRRLSRDRYRILQGPSGQVFFVFANANKGVSTASSNPNIWTAIRYGLDYRALVAVAGTGSAQPAGVIPNGILGALPAGERITRNLSRARAAVRASGIENPTLSLEYASDLTFSGGVQAAPIAQLVQANLKEIGITVNLNPAPTSVALARWRAAQAQLGAWDIVPQTGDPSTFLAFCPGGRYGLRAGWSPEAAPAIDAVCNQAQSAVGRAKRTTIYRSLQRMLNRQSPFFPLIQEPTVTVTAKSVTNVPLPAVSRNIYFPELGIG